MKTSDGWLRFLGLVLLGSLVSLQGCASHERPAVTLSLPVITPEPTPTPERWIQVRKSERVLLLYEGQQIIRSYPIVLGKDPLWAKLYQGDHRTPEGDYHIIKKYYHPFWSRFMLLDYPTQRNWEIYEWSQDHDALPGHGHSVPGIGGAIGIHGTEDEALNRSGTNWTEGCISLFNHDVDELYELVPIGTRVVIER